VRDTGTVRGCGSVPPTERSEAKRTERGGVTDGSWYGGGMGRIATGAPDDLGAKIVGSVGAQRIVASAQAQRNG